MNIGFIGSGRMAQALAKGFITAGLTRGEKIIASCAPEDTFSADSFKELGATVDFNNQNIVRKSNVTIIAVKPLVMPVVLHDIKDAVNKDNLIISVAMGFSIMQMEQVLPKGTRVIRAMPNTPALVQKGATVIAQGTSIHKGDADIAKTLFGSVGTCEEAPEYLFDTVTALSGSGPAYLYTVIEAMADGAVRMGMPRDLAYRLAAQTTVGAGSMVLKTGEHPGQLKDNVSSPAGSTCEGLYRLEKGGFRGLLIKAIEHATRRCKETSQARE